MTRQMAQEYPVLHKHRVVKRRTTRSEHGFAQYPNLVFDQEVTHPDQVWVSDLTYVCLHSEFVYLRGLRRRGSKPQQGIDFCLKTG